MQTEEYHPNTTQEDVDYLLFLDGRIMGNLLIAEEYQAKFEENNNQLTSGRQINDWSIPVADDRIFHTMAAQYHASLVVYYRGLYDRHLARIEQRGISNSDVNGRRDSGVDNRGSDSSGDSKDSRRKSTKRSPASKTQHQDGATEKGNPED